MLISHRLQAAPDGRSAGRGLRAPMVQAFENGTEHARRRDAHTIASGRGRRRLEIFSILRAVRESKGFAIAVDDEGRRARSTRVAREEGLLLCPEGAATTPAAEGLRWRRARDKNDRVMVSIARQA